MPRAFIQEEISRWQSRMGAERKVRRVRPESSLKRESIRQRAMTSLARSVMSSIIRARRYRRRVMRAWIYP